MNTVWKTDIDGLNIALIQGEGKKGVKLYGVIYGKQYTSGLDYNEAGKELGLCILHALFCAGNLD